MTSISMSDFSVDPGPLHISRLLHRARLPRKSSGWVVQKSGAEFESWAAGSRPALASPGWIGGNGRFYERGTNSEISY
jgi:hypothetical protein